MAIIKKIPSDESPGEPRNISPTDLEEEILPWVLSLSFSFGGVELDPSPVEPVVPGCRNLRTSK